MISTQVLPYPAERGDSRLDRVVSRASAAEAVVGRASALVAFVAQSRVRPGDRTLLRLLASVFSLLFAPALRAMQGARGIVRPEEAWSITQRSAASNRVSAVGRIVLRIRAAHPLPNRAAAVESPTATACAVTDETRDPDQCDPAGNAGRHSRGRRAS